MVKGVKFKNIYEKFFIMGNNGNFIKLFLWVCKI